MQKPWWFKINKPEFEELTSDIYDNQNNKDFKITINKKTYDLKNTNKFWTKITKSEISKNKAEKLYKELIQKDFDALKREKSNSAKKNNILEILKNINAIFTRNCFHYRELPKETIFERSIADRVKLRKQKLDIINKNKEKINNELFKEYFNYSDSATMIKRLKNASDERNKDMEESINEKLNKMKKIIINVPKDESFKIEENKKIIDIVETILELNSGKQLGIGLKILTPNQMLSRLPITLAQLKAGNNSDKLKMKLGNYCILCTDQKNLQNKFIKV